MKLLLKSPPLDTAGFVRYAATIVDGLASKKREAKRMRAAARAMRREAAVHADECRARILAMQFSGELANPVRVTLPAKGVQS